MIHGPEKPDAQRPFVGLNPARGQTVATLVLATSPEPLATYRVPVVAGSQSLHRFAVYARSADRLLGQLAACGQPALVTIKNYSLTGYMWDQVTLLEWGALLRLQVLYRGWRLAEVAPTALRKFVTGEGQAGPEAVVVTLARDYGQTFLASQEAEAYALAQVARCLARPDDFPPWRRAVVARAVRPAWGVCSAMLV